MNKSILIWILLLSSPLLRSAGETSALPNVILFVIDDLSFDGLGCNGNKTFSTPNIDQLAAVGINFTNCYSQPSCAPSRAKLLTGKYGFKNFSPGAKLPDTAKNIGHLMQEAGYTTGFIGKNHVLHSFEKSTKSINDKGFDHYVVSKEATEDLRGFTVSINDKEERWKIIEEHFSDRYMTYAKEFINDDHEAPFFLYWASHLLHKPFLRTPLSRDKVPRHEWLINDPNNFPEMLAYLDQLIGELCRHLQEKGQWENTLLIITADNPMSADINYLTDQGERKGGKLSSNMEALHVPMIIHWPKYIEEGRQSDALVDFTDIAPTLSDIAGIEFTNDGQSLFGLIKNDPGFQSKEFFLGEEYDPNKRFVCDGTFKYASNGELFHIKNDPFEESPLQLSELTGNDKKKAVGLMYTYTQLFGFNAGNQLDK